MWYYPGRVIKVESEIEEKRYEFDAMMGPIWDDIIQQGISNGIKHMMSEIRFIGGDFAEGYRYGADEIITRIRHAAEYGARRAIITKKEEYSKFADLIEKHTNTLISIAVGRTMGEIGYYGYWKDILAKYPS